jgi:putative transposase
LLDDHSCASRRHSPAHHGALNGNCRTHGRYAQCFNARIGHVGHLWQGRFFHKRIEADALGAVLRYVELNPVRAGLVSQAWDYPWSSAAAHLGARDTSGLLDLPAWFAQWDIETWRQQLIRPEDPIELQRLRAYLYED